MKYNRGAVPHNARYIEIGTRIGRRVVVGGPIIQHGHRCYLTRCDCGTERFVSVTLLLKGTHQSCGCLTAEKAGARTRTHGESTTRLYQIWYGIKKRCYNPKCNSYKDYGGRGISVCDEWRASFESFASWAKSHGYNEALVIDRIDANGKYDPANCRWVTRAESNRNTRVTRQVTLFGETKIVGLWLKDPRIPVRTATVIHRRLALGWSLEAALTTPPIKPTWHKGVPRGTKSTETQQLEDRVLDLINSRGIATDGGE